MFRLLLLRGRSIARPGPFVGNDNHHHYHRQHGPEWFAALSLLSGAAASAAAAVAAAASSSDDRTTASAAGGADKNTIAARPSTSCLCEAAATSARTTAQSAAAVRAPPPPQTTTRHADLTKNEASTTDDDLLDQGGGDDTTSTTTTPPGTSSTTEAATTPTATSAAALAMIAGDEQSNSSRGSSSSLSTSSSSSSSTVPFRLADVYDIEKILGEGAYGMVYQARRKCDGTLVALKTMPRALTGKTDFEREVAALQLLSKAASASASTSSTGGGTSSSSSSTGGASSTSSTTTTPHPHIVQFKDLHRDETNYYLAMELIEGGELLEHLIENGPYSEALAASFLRQFAEAICFVHDNNLCHADLKPENLLLSSNDVNTAMLIVADFGCARSHDQSRQEMHLPAHEFAIGCSFLHMVALGNQFELERLLQEKGPSLVNFRDYDFRTPLHLAASEGHVDICRFLVEKGARVNRSDRWGGSPLDDAHRHRHAEVIEYLRQQGATFGSLTQLPRFIQAASEGDKQEVEALLEFGNIDLDQGDYDSRTALHLASGEGRSEIVELLCKAGANVNVEDRWGNRPLDDAKNAKKNSARIIGLLKKFGAKSIKNPGLGRLQSLRADGHSTEIKKTTRRKEQHETVSGTMAYWSPELFNLANTPNPASDMWASGVIMYVLLTGSHPFDTEGRLTDDEIKEAIIQVGVDKDDHMKLMNERVFDERINGLSDSCVDLMRRLMHPDPLKRMTSEAFLRHPWTQGLTASGATLGKTHDELKGFWQNQFRAEILKKFAASLGISNDELSEQHLHDIFHALDLKKNGALERDEIQTTFREMGFSDKNIRTIFSCADLDGSGVISFDEFRELLLNKNADDGPGLQVGYLQQRFKSDVLKRFSTKAEKALTDKEKLREIYNAIDLDGNGILDMHDIRVVLRTVGEPETVISRIVESLDVKHDGRVSWDDFLNIMGMKDK